MYALSPLKTMYLKLMYVLAIVIMACLKLIDAQTFNINLSKWPFI